MEWEVLFRECDVLFMEVRFLFLCVEEFIEERRRRGELSVEPSLECEVLLRELRRCCLILETVNEERRRGDSIPGLVSVSAIAIEEAWLVLLRLMD